MSTSFLPFPSRFFSRKSRSKRVKTDPPKELVSQPTIVHRSPLPIVPPPRTAPPFHSQGYASSRHTDSSGRSAHTTEGYATQRGYPDVYWPRKIPSMNELSHRSNVPSPQTRPRARHVFNSEAAHLVSSFSPRPAAPSLMQYDREREEVWRGRRFSEQVPHTQPGLPLSRSTSVGGHIHPLALEPPWQGVIAASIEEESESEEETEGALGPLEVLEAFFNEEPLPECIVLSLPASPTGYSNAGHLQPNRWEQPGPSSPPTRAASSAFTQSPVASGSSPSPPAGLPPPGSRPRTTQLISTTHIPSTPPRRHFPSGAGLAKSPPRASPPLNPAKSSFSLPRLRRNSSRARRNEMPLEPPPSPPRDEELPYLQRPLPPTPPERGDSFRNRLMSRHRRSGDKSQPDPIQEEVAQPALRQLGEALSLSPAPRPRSLVAYIIPPEERARIGHQRRGSMSSVSSAGDSTWATQTIHRQKGSPAQPQAIPISPFRLTFNPPTGLNPPPRPRSSMVSTRSAGSSNSHWSPAHQQSVLTSSTLRYQDDRIAYW